MRRARRHSFFVAVLVVALLASAAASVRAGTPIVKSQGDPCIPSGIPMLMPVPPEGSAAVRATTDRVLFGWPLVWPFGHPHLRIVDYVDEDPTNGLTHDYTGGSYCYDGHLGTDINLNGFEDMDAGVPIVAAAPGRVTFVQDWDYDRQVDAPHSTPGNGVVILHEDGTASTYWHMRTHSATVQPGEYVREGQILGLVGSAGTTTNPHLHFQVDDWLHGGNIDPWGGAVNPLPSRWKVQAPYVGTIPVEIKILAVTTGTEFSFEGGLGSWLGFKSQPSQPVVFGADEPILKVWSLVSGTTRTPFTVDVRRPDGSLFAHLDGVMPPRSNGQSFQYWDVPFTGSVSAAEYGTWTVEAFHDGASLFRDEFLVGETSRFAPRFAIGGRSFHLSAERQEDVLSTSYLGAPAESLSFALENAPENVSLRTDQDGQTIVVIDPAGPDLANVRSREFAVVATDPDGRQGRMHYHLVNYDASTLGSPPVVSVPADISVSEGDSVVVEVSAGDPDGDAISDLSANLGGLPAGDGPGFDVAPDHATGRLVWSTKPGEQGTYTVHFTATTSFGENPFFGYPPIVQSGTADLTIHVVPGLEARAFTSGGDRTLRLRSGKPYWCVHVEAVGGSFDPATIDPATVHLISPTTGRVDRISAVLSDLDISSEGQDSLPEATLCFGRQDVEDLFSEVVGERTVACTIAGSLRQGRGFSAPLDVDVVGPRLARAGAMKEPGSVLGVGPNPSSGGVSFRVQVPAGEAGSIDVFNLAGQRVRHVELPGGNATPRVLRWDGRGVGAGVYWARLTVGARTWERRLVLLK